MSQQNNRSRTAPCLCQLCKGAERDYQTVNRHFTGRNLVEEGANQDDQVDQRDQDENDEETPGTNQGRIMLNERDMAPRVYLPSYEGSSLRSPYCR